MNPALRTLASLCLLGLLGPAAFACTLCDRPLPQATHEGAAAEPFDTRRPPGLLPEERTALLAAESGRFTLKSFHFVDGKAAEPKAHLLSNEAAQAFLKNRAQSLVAGLRAKQDAGQLLASDRQQALLLYWYRGPLLAAAERGFLASLNQAAFGRAPPKPEGSGKGPVSAGPAAAPDDGLLQRLRGQLEFDDHGDPRQAAELDAAVNRLLESPTARTIAEEFIAQGKKVRVSFEPVENSKVIELNGKKIIRASGGSTASDGDKIHVRLNKDYLGTDADFIAAELPSTLGHELLGHGLEHIKARKAGVDDTYGAYHSNEANAGLVGWIVDAERGVPLNDGHMWSYLRDPEEYHRGLKTNMAYYAGTFSTEEMERVVPVLSERLANAKKELARQPQLTAQEKAWLPIIDHFVSVHGIKSASFTSEREAIASYIDDTAPSRQARLQEIIAYVQSHMDWYKTKDGAKDIARMKADAKKPFFAEVERAADARRTHLKTLTDGRPQAESFTPPPPGQIERAELQEMYQKDKKEHPEHWPK